MWQLAWSEHGSGVPGRVPRSSPYFVLQRVPREHVGLAGSEYTSSPGSLLLLICAHLGSRCRGRHECDTVQRTRDSQREPGARVVDWHWCVEANFFKVLNRNTDQRCSIGASRSISIQHRKRSKPLHCKPDAIAMVALLTLDVDYRVSRRLRLPTSSRRPRARLPSPLSPHTATPRSRATAWAGE